MATSSLEIESNLCDERIRKPSSFFDDQNASSSATICDNKKFQIYVYNIALNVVLSQIDQQYHVVAKIKEKFNVLQNFSKVESISAKCEVSANDYSHDLNGESLLA